MKLRLFSLLIIAFTLLLLGDSFVGPTPADRGLDLGNPAESRMLADTGLITLDHPGYQVVYEHARNQALLTAWHLQASDLGAAERSTAGFAPEVALPTGWYRVLTGDYTGSGYDRGHLCPSADRTASPFGNRDTFVLSNVIPQAQGLNRHTWESLEAFTRQQVRSGSEAYIFAGGIGEQARIGLHRNLPVPAYCWKVILLMPAGDADTHRPAQDYRLIVVLMPNIDKVSTHPWTDYQLTLDQLEALTNLNFFSQLAPDVRAELCIR